MGESGKAKPQDSATAGLANGITPNANVNEAVVHKLPLPVTTANKQTPRLHTSTGGPS